MKTANLLKAAAAALAIAVLAPAGAEQTRPGLKLPHDIEAQEGSEGAGGAEAGKTGGIQYREQHVGKRLERVTLTRENGFTETYRNNRADTIWSAPENEIGETSNLRRWIIRTW